RAAANWRGQNGGFCLSRFLSSYSLAIPSPAALAGPLALPATGGWALTKSAGTARFVVDSPVEETRFEPSRSLSSSNPASSSSEPAAHREFVFQGDPCRRGALRNAVRPFPPAARQ